MYWSCDQMLMWDSDHCGSLIVLSSVIVKNLKIWVSCKVKSLVEGTFEKVIQIIHQMSLVLSSDDVIVKF